MQWKNVISEIQTNASLTQPQIASKAGCAQTTISDLATGKTAEPRHSLGEALLALRRQTQRKRKAIADSSQV